MKQIMQNGSLQNLGGQYAGIHSEILPVCLKNYNKIVVSILKKKKSQAFWAWQGGTCL
jgi:hypothetical protein